MKSFPKRKYQERKSLEQGIITNAIDPFFVLLLHCHLHLPQGGVGVRIGVARVAKVGVIRVAAKE